MAYQISFHFLLQNINEDEEDEGFPADIFARLVVRPEDLPENVTASIKRYKDLMLRMLEVSIKLFDNFFL